MIWRPRMLAYLIALRLARSLHLLQRVVRLGKVPRHPGQLLVRVWVTGELRGERELVLDAVQTGRDGCREPHVGIRVRARDPAFDGQTGSVPDDAEAASPVVPAPHDRRRGEGGGLVALVRVHKRRIEE